MVSDTRLYASVIIDKGRNRNSLHNCSDTKIELVEYSNYFILGF